MPRSARPFPAARSALLALVLGAVVGACAVDEPTGPDGCTGPVAISVSGGTQPTFTWAPACPVARLVVYEVAADTNTFGPTAVMLGDGRRSTISPPLRYPVTATPLVPGRRYAVYVRAARPECVLDLVTTCAGPRLDEVQFVP